ncbi:hypothetical protein BH23THE1_BH23THE1_22900 [soil metagenome]
MNISSLFIITIAIATVTLILEFMTPSILAQTPTTSDLPMTTINETNPTVDVLNKTLPPENATDVVPVVPM